MDRPLRDSRLVYVLLSLENPQKNVVRPNLAKQPCAKKHEIELEPLQFQHVSARHNRQKRHLQFGVEIIFKRCLILSGLTSIKIRYPVNQKNGLFGMWMQRSMEWNRDDFTILTFLYNCTLHGHNFVEESGGTYLAFFALCLPNHLETYLEFF